MTALEKILAYKRDEVKAAKAQSSNSDLNKRIADQTPPRGFKRALDEKVANRCNALICEVKRKSPSAGEILPGADPISIVTEYEAGGAACLSILTDNPSFGGHLDDLVTVKSRTNLPVLRKDFMVDPFQVTEARAYGADCVLVIMAALDDVMAKAIHDEARGLGMDVLVEVHDREELHRAERLGSDMIGVNNRDLKRMVTDLGVSVELAGARDKHELISESGVKTVEDISQLRLAGYERFLIGESLMKASDRENAVRMLVEAR